MRVAFALTLLGIAACGGDKVHHLGDAGTEDSGVPHDAADDVDAAPDAPPPDAFRVIADLKGEIGYLDAAGKPTALVFFNEGRPALCKVASAAKILSTDFTDCPAADGDGTVTFPVTPTAGTTDGSYEADVLATDAQGNKVAYQTTFYIHRSLDNAQPCPADPAKWPSDKAFFDEAVKTFTAPIKEPPSWMTADTGALPHNQAFALSAMNLVGPFYKLHFKGVTLGTYARLAIDTVSHVSPSQTSAGSEFDLPVWSLRHHLAVSSDKGLVIIYRQYESRAGARRGEHLCTMPTRFGFAAARQEFNCDAIVLNAAGEGFCMGVDASGAPKQLVFARQMVAKLMAQSIGDELPRAQNGTVWGPKVFAPQTDPAFDDSQIETPMPGHPGSHTVILRP